VDLCGEHQKLVAQLQHVTTVAYGAVWWALASEIVLALKPSYSLLPLDIHIVCSCDFYNQFTHGWPSYTPSCCCCGSPSTTSLHTFLSCLPGWQLSCQVFVQTKQTLIYHLITSEDHPIYTIYSDDFAHLSLSLHYLPDPLPHHFVPCFCFGSVHKHHLFYSIHRHALPPCFEPTPSSPSHTPLSTLPTATSE
jgi:hypothetical protein